MTNSISNVHKAIIAIAGSHRSRHWFDSALFCLAWGVAIAACYLVAMMSAQAFLFMVQDEILAMLLAWAAHFALALSTEFYFRGGHLRAVGLAGSVFCVGGLVIVAGVRAHLRSSDGGDPVRSWGISLLYLFIELAVPILTGFLASLAHAAWSKSRFISRRSQKAKKLVLADNEEPAKKWASAILGWKQEAKQLSVLSAKSSIAEAEHRKTKAALIDSLVSDHTSAHPNLDHEEEPRSERRNSHEHEHEEAFERVPYHL